MRIIALFGPTGVGKTAVAVALAGAAARAGRGPGGGFGGRAAGVRGPGDAHRRGDAGRAGAPGAPAGVVPAARRARSASGSTRSSPTRRSTTCSPPAGARSSWAARACTCARRSTELEPAPAAAGGRARALDGELERRGAPALHARLQRARAVGGAGDRPQRPPARGARARAAGPGRGAGAARGAPRSCGARSCAIRRCWSGLTMQREALYAAIDARVDAMLAAGAREEVRRAHAAGASRDGAQGARLRGAARGRRGGDEAAHAQLRQAPADVDAQARGRAA